MEVCWILLSVDESISTHERVSENGIIEGILGPWRGEEDESDNEDIEDKDRKRRKYCPYIY